MKLTEFLLARIAEDEAAAKAGPQWEATRDAVVAWWDANEDEPGFYADDQPDDVKGLAKTLLQIDRARHDPARVLAECEAKRQIVETHRHADYSFGNSQSECPTMPRPLAESMILRDFAACDTLLLLATVYADHPDYYEAWRP